MLEQNSAENVFRYIHMRPAKVGEVPSDGDVPRVTPAGAETQQTQTRRARPPQLSSAAADAERMLRAVRELRRPATKQARIHSGLAGLLNYYPRR